jgi:hypothetical protein
LSLLSMTTLLSVHVYKPEVLSTGSPVTHIGLQASSTTSHS